MAKVASESALFKSLGDDSLQVANLFDVKGWVAVVTGGGTGLGLVTAHALARNGCKVYITGRRQEPLEAAAQGSGKDGKGEIIPIVADVATKEGILKLRDAVSAKEQHVNLLVNNHGVSQGAPDINSYDQTPEGLSKGMFEDESFERWADTYRINTTSYYFTSFAFLPLLAAAAKSGPGAETGNIVNLSSMSGITPTSQRGQFNYNAGKAATISLSKQLATEFARRGLGVRVNCVCPGYFPSGMTVIHPDDNTNSDEHFKEYRDNWGIPFGRPGSAIDYAQCILGLVTNRYTTGAEIVIDGGWLLQTAF